VDIVEALHPVFSLGKKAPASKHLHVKPGQVRGPATGASQARRGMPHPGSPLVLIVLCAPDRASRTTLRSGCSIAAYRMRLRAGRCS
jgi:hypothetical protein